MASNFLLYLLQSSVVFTLLFGMYRIFVSGLTFHKVNRAILLSLPLLSLLLPLIDITGLIQQINTQSLVSPLPQLMLEPEGAPFFEIVTNHEISEAGSWLHHLDFVQLLLSIYLAGVVFVLVRSLISTKQILGIKHKAKKHRYNGHELLLTNLSSTFSYFHWIFVPESEVENINHMVLQHEVAHIKHRHTLDLVFAQLYTAMFWFNPIAATYRKTLKALHEYQADAHVLKMEIKKSDYLGLILDNINRAKGYHSLSYFNNLIIKKRIDMITKNQSKKHYSLAYAFLLFGVVAIILGFNVPDAAPPQLPNVQSGTEMIQVEPPSIFPLQKYDPNTITGVFGQQVRQPKTRKIIVHQGVDIRAPKGTPVLATADGTIAKAELDGNWGNLVIINHTDGFQTWYAHLDGFATEANFSIKKGDVIGYVGTTGLSSGYHLHYEVRKNQQHLDPSDFFKK